MVSARSLRIAEVQKEYHSALQIQADTIAATVANIEKRVRARALRFRVLVVDDNPGDLFLLRDLFERTFPRAEIVGATNAREAFRLLETEEFDLLLVDLVIPGGPDGMEIIEQIRRSSRRPMVPVILMSGEVPSQRLVIVARTVGAHAFLRKAELDVQLVPLIHYLIPELGNAETNPFDEKTPLSTLIGIDGLPRPGPSRPPDEDG